MGPLKINNLENKTKNQLWKIVKSNLEMCVLGSLRNLPRIYIFGKVIPPALLLLLFRRIGLAGILMRGVGGSDSSTLRARGLSRHTPDTLLPIKTPLPTPGRQHPHSPFIKSTSY